VADIAAIAPTVLDAAADGDGVAQAIVHQEARQLATLAAGLARRFAGGGPIRVAWGGGLLSRRADYRELVMVSVREFVPRATIAAKPVDAPLGAIRMAMKLSA
jgi:N-acetylglucosamine kinase-like BadF-type ATPase